MDVICRPMVAADLDAASELHVRAWQTAYRGIVPQAFLDGMDPAVRRRRNEGRSLAGQHVAEAGGEVVGWLSVGPYRDDDPPGPGCGEIEAIYARPDVVGAGVGRVLLAYGLGELRRHGLAPVLLWVLTGNDHARRFYEKAGFAADGATHDYEVGGATLPELRYRYDG
ncbi:MAG TPA: GNAT family N-acetyltransferase [Mycobacteriales bacterium]|jgi:GNAT superfamily N-acetyltransferase|nr:GNAT family N-acetyltransferase [Mycobacteriales bacterium]